VDRHHRVDGGRRADQVRHPAADLRADSIVVRGRAGGGRDLRAILDGVRLIRHSQPLFGAFLADLAFSVLAMPLALFPAINAQRFGGNPHTLGLMLTAIGVGGLAGAVLSGPLAHVSRPGLAMLVCVFGSGLAFAAFAVAPGLWLTLLTLAVVGAVDGFTVALRGTIVQVVAPGEFRGRAGR
jgi:predicted MFS family arabinose efflux permease